MSPALKAAQRKTLGEAVVWHDRLEEVPEGPMVLVANEFFDAIPIRQFERRDGAWHERAVGLRDEQLALGLIEAQIGNEGRDGDIIEFASARADIAREIGGRLSRAPGAALVIDYGHTRTAPGDTLQAMKKHKYVSVLEDPGSCDLTSHVDFEALGKAMAHTDVTVHPVLSQRAFLLAMGLEQRTAQLSARADIRTRAILGRQMARLAAEDQMGNLFKVLAATSASLSTPYPFGRT
jgi:SAM-dependent MidA family methyltransferase